MSIPPTQASDERDLSLARELGPAMTVLLFAGRSGSSMASELATMRVSEEIDAMETMAVNAIQYLVVPRVVASTIMCPALTIIFVTTGWVGCFYTGTLREGLDPGAALAAINVGIYRFLAATWFPEWLEEPGIEVPEVHVSGVVEGQAALGVEDGDGGGELIEIPIAVRQQPQQLPDPAAVDPWFQALRRLLRDPVAEQAARARARSAAVAAWHERTASS